MELEVYNEYAIVQHYSDLTDYISENIYILDKKNQSEIITENWGLIAIGGLVVVAIAVTIWLLVKKSNENKKQNQKMEKTEKEVTQVQQAAERAVEQSGISDNQISSIGGLLCYSILRNMHSLEHKHDENDLTKGFIGTNQEYFDLDEFETDANTNMAARMKLVKKIEELKNRLKNASNPKIKLLLNGIKIEDIRNQLKDMTFTKITISPKVSKIIGSFLKEEYLGDQVAKAEKESEEAYKDTGIGRAETIPASINNYPDYVKYLQSAYKGLYVNVLKNEDPKAAESNFKQLVEVLYKYKTFPETIITEYKEANSDIDNILEPLKKINDDTELKSLIMRTALVINKLSSRLDNFDIDTTDTEYGKLKDKLVTNNFTEEKLKDTIRIALFHRCIELITYNFDYKVTGNNEIIINDNCKIKISGTDIKLKDLLTNTTISGSQKRYKSVQDIQKQLEEKFKNANNYKKGINQITNYLGKRILYFCNTIDKAIQYYDAIKLAYAIVLGVSNKANTVTSATDTQVQSRINELNSKKPKNSV